MFFKTLKRLMKTMQKMKKQGDPDLWNGPEFLDCLKSAPDPDKQKLHLEQMVIIYRESRADPFKLEDGDLDLWTAASSGVAGHPQRCPFCGVELPPAQLEEHQRLKHGEYR